MRVHAGAVAGGHWRAVPVQDCGEMTTEWWSVVSRMTAVTSAPALQVAGDGRWETAVTIPVDDASRLATRLERVAASARRDVAVEVLWPGQVFVGARWSLAESGGAGANAALAGARRALAVLSASYPAEAALLALLHSTPNLVPEFAELGAVNAWASVGPLTLWRRTKAFTPAAVGAALASRPDLTECRYPVAVEVAATGPRACWVGVTVSNLAGSVHLLDRDALDEVLARATGPSH